LIRGILTGLLRAGYAVSQCSDHEIFYENGDLSDLQVNGEKWPAFREVWLNMIKRFTQRSHEYNMPISLFCTPVF